MSERERKGKEEKKKGGRNKCDGDDGCVRQMSVCLFCFFSLFVFLLIFNY